MSGDMGEVGEVGEVREVWGGERWRWERWKRLEEVEEVGRDHIVSFRVKNVPHSPQPQEAPGGPGALEL